MVLACRERSRAQPRPEISGWVNTAAASGFVITVGTWAIGWIFEVPWFVGLLLGLVAWVVILNGFVARSRRALRPATGPGGGVIRIPTAESFDQLKEEVRQMQADLKQSEEQRERLAAERDALAEGRNHAPVRRVDQLDHDELKNVALVVAEDLHQFLEDYAIDEADRAEAMGADFELDVMRADTETMREFRKRLKPRDMGLLAELKRRGWWKQKDFDLPEWEAVESLAHPHDLQLIADRLERLGYDL